MCPRPLEQPRGTCPGPSKSCSCCIAQASVIGSYGVDRRPAIVRQQGGPEAGTTNNWNEKDRRHQTKGYSLVDTAARKVSK